MVAVQQPTEYEVSGSPIDGWALTAMRASYTNLTWSQICTELIDNALAHRKRSGQSVINIAWQAGTLSIFSVTDNGRGSTDIEAFTKPGKSCGNLHEDGNSTFGTGLFACECRLYGTMFVSTDAGDGTIRTVRRTIKTHEHGTAREYDCNDQERAASGIPELGGTVVKFIGYEKRAPTKFDLQKVLSHIGYSYSPALQSGKLGITVSHAGQDFQAIPEATPELIDKHTHTVESGGHKFDIEWGVTTKPSKDGGCRIVYGGKILEKTTVIPCGDFSPGRFYASIRIPPSFGKAVMDLLKRDVDYDMMDDVFEQCSVLFEKQLAESDLLSTDDKSKLLTQSISQMLSAPKKAKDGDDHSGNGNRDVREFKGRDDAAEGVKPTNTGRKRVGRKGSKSPDSIVVHFIEAGPDEPYVKFDCDGASLRYNLSKSVIAEWKDADAKVPLAQAAAANMAHEIRDKDAQKKFGFDDDDFDTLYFGFIERIREASKLA